MRVSICVVAFNEEGFLPNLLSDFEKQTYPSNLIELVLVNSMSTDKTKRIMEEYAKNNDKFYSVVVKDNPKKIQASGWNVAIKSASGDIIIRIDAHTHIPSEFVSLNVDNIKNGENISGGVRPCLIENNSKWSRTLLDVENSLFGSSFNKCRRETKGSYVKTMFHAAYRREVFEIAGGFNENLLRTEDNEMHYRLRENGYKLFFDPKIISYQYARNNLKKMIKQKFGNGKWIGITLGVCPKCVSLFHLVPFCFIFGIILTTILCFFGWWYFSAIMWMLYFLFGVINTIISIKNNGFNFYKIFMPIIFLFLHISYGIGTIIGILSIPFQKKK